MIFTSNLASRTWHQCMARFRILIILFFGLFSFAYPQKELQDQAVAITINATPIPAFQPDNPSQTRFGSLEFRGGLVLTSTHKSFGGISALRVQARWGAFSRAFRSGLVVPAGALFTKTTALPASPMRPRLPFLMETENRLPDGIPSRSPKTATRYMSALSASNSIFRFDFDWKSFPANARPVPVPPELKDLPFNQGLEAMVFVPKKYKPGRNLDWLLGKRPHGRRKPEGIPDRRTDARNIRRKAHGRLMTSAMRRFCRTGTFSFSSANILCSAALRCASAASGWTTSNRAPWSTAQRSSRPTRAIRSITWKPERVPQPFRRDRAHAYVRRQFLSHPAHASAAVCFKAKIRRAPCTPSIRIEGLRPDPGAMP